MGEKISKQQRYRQRLSARGYKQAAFWVPERDLEAVKRYAHRVCERYERGDAMHYLETAIEFALQAHAGQTDKAGAPYILHPLRVMTAMTTDETRAAAVLHDVLEDSDTTADDLLKAGIPERVVTAVKALTKRPGEDYSDFVARCAENPIARTVKAADLRDNMDLSRLETVTEKDKARAAKYAQALAQIEEHERYLDAWEMDCRPPTTEHGVTAGERQVEFIKKLKAEREDDKPADDGGSTEG